MPAIGLSTNDLHQEALGHIPGYVAANTALDTVREWRRNPPNGTPRDLRSELYSIAEAGGDLPVDVVDMFAEQAREVVAINNAWETLRALVQDAEARVDEAIAGGADVALAWLHDRLADLTGRVADLDAALGSVGSAEQAIAANTTAEWTTLGKAVTEYDELRQAQAAILRTHSGGEADWTQYGIGTLLSAGLLAGHLEHEQHWVDRRRDAARRSDDDRGQFAGHIAWLKSTPHTGWSSAVAAGFWWPTDDRAGYLRWAATTAQPWIPSIDAMTEAWETAEHATATIRFVGGVSVEQQVANAQAARRRNADITGTEPAVPTASAAPTEQSRTNSGDVMLAFQR